MVVQAPGGVENEAGARNAYCHRPAKQCRHYPNETCFGRPLPYDHVSFDHTGSNYIYEVKSKLRQWQWLSGVPKCWAVIQPLLCAVYMPECDPDAETVEKVSHRLCRAAQGPCRIVPSSDWPRFLRCDNATVFEQFGCEDDRWTNPRQNASLFAEGSCEAPLVETVQASKFFHEIDGCGMQCDSPLFAGDEYAPLSNFLRLMFVLVALAASFAIFTHLVTRWGKLFKYPNVATFYMWVSWLFLAVAVLMQFVYPGREGLVCSSDGTRYMGGSREATNHWCNFNFFLLYVGFTCKCVASLCYNYHSSQSIRGTEQKSAKLINKTKYFNWSMVMIVVFFMALVFVVPDRMEGDSVLGVCLMGPANSLMRILFLVVPNSLSTLASVFFSRKTILALHQTWKMEQEKSSKKERAKWGMIRHSTFLACLIFQCLAISAYILYDYVNVTTFDEALKTYAVCKARRMAPYSSDAVMPECKVPTGPYGLVVTVSLIVILSAAFEFLSIFVHCKTLKALKESLKAMVRRDDKGSKRRNKKQEKERRWSDVALHQMVRKAYEKRGRLAETGRISVSLPSLSSAQHNPIDLRYLGHETNTSYDLESVAAALPRLVQRRNAICAVIQQELSQAAAAGASSDLSRSQSIASRLSVLSRRTSVDSQRSLQPHELRHLQKIYRRSKKGFLGMKSRRQKKRLGSTKNLSYTSANESGTSYGDHSVSKFSQVIPAITKQPVSYPESADGSSSIVSSTYGIPLRPLPAASRQSEPPTTTNLPSNSPYRDQHDELLAKLALLEAASVETAKTANMACASVQTSLTDLSTLGRFSPKETDGLGYGGAVKKTMTTGTQCDIAPPVPSLASTNETSSSSQPLRHVDANVIQISQSSSSVPSSCSDPKERALSGGGGKENHHQPPRQRVPPPREFHNRERRGALVTEVKLGGSEELQLNAQALQASASTMKTTIGDDEDTPVES